MTDNKNEKLPLSWRQRRTPMRNQRRSKNWRKIYKGYRFPDGDWEVVQGPWRKLKKAGSASWVTVLCLGCNTEHDRRLDLLVEGRSKRCRACYLRQVRRTDKADPGAEQEQGLDQGLGNAE